MLGKFHEIGNSVPPEDSYLFPNESIALGSGDTTHSSILISKSIETLCKILIDIKIEIRESREAFQNNLIHTYKD